MSVIAATLRRVLSRQRNLAFDLGDELVDLKGCRQGLLALDPGQSGLAVSIGEKEFGEAGQEQGPAHEGDEEHRVLPEEAASHSITSSALARILRGTVTRSSFAVLRLITRSNRVGCSMGRSAGLAPFRI